jgi:TetR/AcrR family transcriptional regulator, transcriptional repressor of bet genes
MKLKSISDIRRQELRRAAFAVLQAEGLSGATLEKVAQYAGASKGIVLHYFRNKQELFEQAMREANSALRLAVIIALQKAQTPEQRLRAIVETNFDPQFFQPSVCQGWLFLCAEVPRDANLARIQTVIHARMRSNLLSALRPILPAELCDSAALHITTLIDGLWLRCGLETSPVTTNDALALANKVVDEILSKRIDIAR